MKTRVLFSSIFFIADSVFSGLEERGTVRTTADQGFWKAPTILSPGTGPYEGHEGWISLGIWDSGANGGSLVGGRKLWFGPFVWSLGELPRERPF